MTSFLQRVFLILGAALVLCPVLAFAGTVSYDPDGWLVDGRRTLLLCGTLSSYRVPPHEWDSRLRAMKAAGLNMVDLYICWDQHEPRSGQFDFSSPQNDLDRFLRLCEDLELYVYARPGPYINNESSGGGLPGWLLEDTSPNPSSTPDGQVALLEPDADFLSYVERYFDRLNEVLRPHLHTRGGCIVLYALANEHDWFALFKGLGQLIGTDVEAFLTALRDAVLADGIDVPLTTAAGKDVTWLGTGDVPGVIPCPNLYSTTPGRSIEGEVLAIRTDMHDPAAHFGRYVGYPSMISETERTAVRLARVLMGGMDGVNLFNFNGYSVEGYRNGMNLDFDLGAGTDPQVLLRTLRDQAATFIPGQIDYRSPITPRSALRGKYFEIRRVAHFFRAFEETIASAGSPFRTGANANSSRLHVSNPALGALEASSRAVYWLEAGQTSFISLLNQTGQDQTALLTVDNETFPRFSTLTVPSGNSFGARHERWYDMILVHDLPLGRGMPSLHYCTSELFTLASFNGRQLLILYGKPGTEGELCLEDANGAPVVLAANLRNFSEDERTATRLAFHYTHEQDGELLLECSSGLLLHIVVTSTREAGRLFLATTPQGDWLLSDLHGLDQVDSQSRRVSLYVRQTSQDGPQHFLLAPGPVAQLEVDGRQVPFQQDPRTHRILLTESVPAPSSSVHVNLGSGLARSEADLLNETSTHFDDSSWRACQGGPRALEEVGIYRGHAWYRTRAELASAPSGLVRLAIEEASGIVSCYVNGRYAGTFCPLGRQHFTPYALDVLIPADLFHQGRNLLAFRVQVWGRSCFHLPPVPAALDYPGLALDAKRGLWGSVVLEEAFVGAWSCQLNGTWRIGPRLLGERRGFETENADTRSWARASLPLTLQPGGTAWYRVEFDGALLPDPAVWDWPLVLRLEGQNLIGTLFLNGHLIGRWISDPEAILREGFPRIIRDLWVPPEASVDEFSIDARVRPSGRNTLVLCLESIGRASHELLLTPSVLTTVELRPNQDAFDRSQGSTIVACRRSVCVNLAPETARRALVGLGHGSGGWMPAGEFTSASYGWSGWRRLPWHGYNSSSGETRPCAGDLDGDGRDEIVIGLGGPPAAGWMAVLDDAANGLALLAWIRVPWSAYNHHNGSTYPCLVDLDGDRRAELLVGLGAGSGGWMTAFEDRSDAFHATGWLRLAWSAYNRTQGETRPQAGDLDGDGVEEIVVGLGQGGEGWMAVLTRQGSAYAMAQWLRVPWSRYNATNGSTHPCFADLDGDGADEFVAGLGFSGGGWMTSWEHSGSMLQHRGWLRVPWSSYNRQCGLTRPVAGDLDADGRQELLIGLGPGSAAWLPLLDDAANGHAPLRWLQVPWEAYRRSHGETFPALFQ